MSYGCVIGEVLQKMFPDERFLNCICFDWLMDPETGQRTGLHCYSDKYKLGILEVASHHLEYDHDHYPTLEQFFQLQEHVAPTPLSRAWRYTTRNPTLLYCRTD